MVDIWESTFHVFLSHLERRFNVSLCLIQAPPKVFTVSSFSVSFVLGSVLSALGTLFEGIDLRFLVIGTVFAALCFGHVLG